MKTLFYVDAVVLALAAVMSVTLGVVCLLFALYTGASPEISRGLNGLLEVTGGFALLAVIAGPTTRAVFKRSPIWKGLQLALFLTMPIVIILIRNGLGLS